MQSKDSILAPGCVAETCSTPLPMSGIAKTFGAITTLAVATKILSGCKKNKLDKTLEPPKIRSGMPLDEYTWMHADAKLTDVQTKAVVDWAKQVRFKYSLEAKPE